VSGSSVVTIYPAIALQIFDSSRLDRESVQGIKLKNAHLWNRCSDCVRVEGKSKVTFDNDHISFLGRFKGRARQYLPDEEEMHVLQWK
jgi:hypothetical protein